MWLNKLEYMLHLGFLYKFLEVTDSVQAYLVTNRKTLDHTFPATPAHRCGRKYVSECTRGTKVVSRERKTLAMQSLRPLWKNLFNKTFGFYNNQVG